MFTLKNKELSTWLDATLTQKGWTSIQLAQKAGMSHAQVQGALQGAGISAVACVALARTLQVPVSTALRKAGHLPQVADDEIPLDRWLSILSQLPVCDRHLVFPLITNKSKQSTENQHAFSG